MRTIHASLCALVALSLASCDSRSERLAGKESSVPSGEGQADYVAAPSAPPSPASAGRELAGNVAGITVTQNVSAIRQLPAAFAPDSIAPSMVIRTGQASVEVDSVEVAVLHVRQLAQRAGGYVANATMQGGKEQLRSATLEVKLPASRFDQAVEGLQPIGKVEFVNVAAEDVGEEYVDIEARVANGRRLEQRLIELLATRTGKLADVLAVEQQLARVREEIERMEGRMRYLRTRSAVSTLSVTVHEPLPVLGSAGSTGVLGESFRQAWRNFIGFLAAVIASLGVVIPMAAIGVALFLLGRRYLPRRTAAATLPPPAT